MSRIYIAGPMSGQPEWGFPAFHAAADRLRAEGYDVANPAEHFNGDTSLAWETYLRAAIHEVTKCDLVAVLPGWEGSRGARLEVLVARNLGIPVVGADTLQPVEGTGSVCLDAYLLVHGDRAKQYGDPRPMYGTVGRIWGAIMGEGDVPPAEVLLLLAGMKLGRYSEKPTRDSLVDAAGYCELVERCASGT